MNPISKIKKSSLLGLLMLTFVITSKAQDSTYVFGSIDKDLVAMERYPLDSSASAVLLLDKGFLSSTFRAYTFNYHGRIKILSKESFDLADISIPTFGGDGVEDLKAVVYNIEGDSLVTTELTEEDFITEEIMEGVEMVTFTFPEVKVGSVLEYQYQLEAYSIYSFLPWYFQSEIPALHSEFTFRTARVERYIPRVYGFKNLTRYTKAYDGYKFEMDSVPAFVEEPYVSNVDDYYSKVSLTYVADRADSWEELIDIIVGWKEFGYMLDESQGIRKVMPKKTKWTIDEKGLADIHRYVANRFKWSGADGLAFSGVPKKVWDRPEISAAEINLTLFMMLKKVGFDVEIVFLSTSDNGLINKEIPTFRQFNYAITSVNLNGKEILLDATSPYRPYNVLPERVINDEGLVIRGGKLRWVNLHENGEFYSQATTVNYKLDEEGLITGHASVSAVNASASTLREDLLASPESEGVDEEYVKEVPDLKIDSISFSGLDDVASPLKLNFDFSTSEYVEKVGNRLFVRPAVFKEFEENPFKLQERILPIDFSLPLTHRYFFNLEIPEGYTVEELPEIKKLAFPSGGGSYTYQLQHQGNHVQLLIRLAISNRLFMAQDYPAVKEIFDIIISKQEERIVLVKEAR